MSEQTMQRYCLECGNPITEDYGFCTVCGRSYQAPEKKENGSANVRAEPQQGPSQEEIDRAQRAFQQYADEYRRRVMENQFRMNLLMVGIWIILSALITISLAFGLDNMMDYFKSAFGLGSHSAYEAAVIGTSFVFALISFTCSVLRKYWKVAIISCLLSALSTVALIYYTETICIYLFLFGFLATLRIKNLRGMYSN